MRRWWIVVLLAFVGCAKGHPEADAAQSFDAASPRDAGRDAGRDAWVPADANAPSDAQAPMDALPPGSDAGTDAFVASDAGPGTDAFVASDAGCAAGLVLCGSSCVDVNASAAHCGACESPCAAGESCIGGDCSPPLATWSTDATAYECSTPGVIGTRVSFTCPPGGTSDSIWGTGEYTHDSSVCNAAVHAGRITRAAGGVITIELRAGRSSYVASTRNGITSYSYGSWRCSFATVGPPCAAGGDCGDLCTDTTSDPLHCGGCGMPCPSGASCADSACVCPSGEAACGGACVDTSTSALHCGACDTACGADEVCSGSSCVCAPGLTPCGASCVDTTSDDAHCGGCDMACTGGEVCAASACGPLSIGWGTTARLNDCAAPGVLGALFSYRCPAGGTAPTAWGTDLYTHDSSICTAAAHVGRITTASGGTVTIEMRPGASSYTGSTRNGITTASWGSWSCSFAVQ